MSHRILFYLAFVFYFQIARETIHSMMGLLGVEEPDLPGTIISAPAYITNGSSNLLSLDKQAKSALSSSSHDINLKSGRDISYSECQEHKMKKNEQEESQKRNKNSENSVKDYEYSSTYSEQCLNLMKGEKKLKTKKKKSENYEVEGTFDKYQSRHKNKYTDRESNQNREKKKKKIIGESEPRCHEHREARKNREGCVIEKHEEVRGQYKNSSGKSHKRERDESDYSYEYNCRENSKGSRHSKSKGYKHGKNYGDDE